MNEKHQKLLHYLASANRTVTSTELSNALGVSTRSIKNYVAQINSTSNNKIILSSRNGYTVNITHRQFLSTTETDQIPQTNEERSFYIIKCLILKPSVTLHLFDLCEYLCISYSTMKSVLSKMNNMYKMYHVQFISENDCVKMLGEEKDKRKLISYVINEESKENFTGITQIKAAFPEFDTDTLYKIIIETFKKHNYYLNDFASSNLLFHLVIMINRKQQGNALESTEYVTPMLNTSEQELLDDIYNYIEKSFDVVFNSYEQTELYILFRANANYSLTNSTQDVLDLVGSEIFTRTQHCVEKINTLYMIDLSSDDFILPFALHIKGLLFRAKNKKFTTNPMAEQIKNNSPIIFDMAISISLDLMDAYDTYISEDETAFLAMHIGAEIERQHKNKSKIPAVLLCPDYHSISTNLLNTLMLDFGNQINIIRSVHSEKELHTFESEFNGSDYMMIFSTIPISPLKKQTIVYISPFDVHNQYEMIQEALIENQKSYKNYKLKEYFHTFFEKDLFVANTKMTNRNQILTFLCDKLEVKGYVDASFEKQIYRREEAATTAFQNIAIPHSVQMDAFKTSISVAISKEGFRWGKNTVHLVLLLAINKADKQTFRVLYESLISLFNNHSTIQEVRNCRTFEEFEYLIYSRIEKF
ncbi:lichenan operon transcriptional antiterminator [Enterococcus sp. DIV2402]|uniref:Lichenan operon transcriptional antiterminator n=1 Tax=Candidatus Enterococcus lowellii TaxID=2230877 RepID=A0ABZ2SRP0_9ENTE|nr:PTS sugar transporter subunit IIA [Enterococcus sp. DIV2402]MBO0464087.1 transcription antiterminator [Enterococcus sp. DIV2402]